MGSQLPSLLPSYLCMYHANFEVIIRCHTLESPTSSWDSDVFSLTYSAPSSCFLHKEAQIFKKVCYLGFQNFLGMSENIQNRFEEIREMINKSKTSVFLLIFNFLVLLIASCNYYNFFFNLWSSIFQQYTLYYNKLTFWHENKTHTQGTFFCLAHQQL